MKLAKSISLALLQMGPSFPVVDHPYGTMSNAKHASNSALAMLSLEGEYFFSLRLCKLGKRVLFAFSVVTVGNALSHVFGVRPPLHVHRVATSQVSFSANMQRQGLVGWLLSVFKFAGDTVDVGKLAVNPNLAVSSTRFAKRPNQTVWAAFSKNLAVQIIQNVLSFCGRLFVHLNLPLQGVTGVSYHTKRQVAT